MLKSGVHRLTAIVIVLVAMLLPPRPVFACTCAAPESPATGFAHADAVFVGTVTGISGQAPAPSLLDRLRSWVGLPVTGAFFARQLSVRVSDSWKGVTTADIEIHTGFGDADCGYNFRVGSQYVIYATKGQTGFETSICLRTIEVASGAADLQYLQTLPRLSLTAAPSTSPLPLLFLSLGMLVSLLLLTVWVRRRRHSSA